MVYSRALISSEYHGGVPPVGRGGPRDAVVANVFKGAVVRQPLLCVAGVPVRKIMKITKKSCY